MFVHYANRLMKVPPCGVGVSTGRC